MSDNENGVEDAVAPLVNIITGAQFQDIMTVQAQHAANVMVAQAQAMREILVAAREGPGGRRQEEPRQGWAAAMRWKNCWHAL